MNGGSATLYTRRRTPRRCGSPPKHFLLLSSRESWASTATSCGRKKRFRGANMVPMQSNRSIDEPAKPACRAPAAAVLEKTCENGRGKAVHAGFVWGHARRRRHDRPCATLHRASGDWRQARDGWGLLRIQLLSAAPRTREAHAGGHQRRGGRSFEGAPGPADGIFIFLFPAARGSLRMGRRGCWMERRPVRRPGQKARR